MRSWRAAMNVAVLAMGASGCAPPSEEVAPDDDASEAESALEAPVVDAPLDQDVTFGRAMDERIHGVKIGDQPHQHPKVVYSVALDDLGSEERLRVRGEVTLSRCNDKDIAGQSGDAATTPCSSAKMRKNPYDYAPRFAARYVLADGPGATEGKPLSDWRDTRCNESRHHCALSLPEASAKDLPAAERKYVNLVVAADAAGHGAHSWDVMEVEQHHGSLAVTRLAPGADDQLLHEGTTKDRTPADMGIDQTEDEGDDTQVRRLVYQVKLDGLKPGDVVDADATMKAELGGGFSCNPLITSQVLITERADSIRTQRPGDAQLTSRNGSNCTEHGGGTCRYEHSGAVRLGNKAKSTMYVSLVALAARSCAAPGGGDRWKVRDGDGSLRVNVRR